MAFYDTTQIIDYLVASVLTSSALAAMTPAVKQLYPYEVDAFPNFPSIAIIDDGLDRKFSGSHIWTLTLGVQLIVMHASLSTPSSTRTQQDLQLARQVEQLIHVDRKLAGNMVDGYITKSRGGVLRTQDDTIKCSFLTYRGTQREVST